MIGTTLAHYQITASIGVGGMGVVYRATDSRLGREVALKVLPADLSGSPDRLERFRREARALAALDHPGIVTIYSVEEAAGVHFLTMQLIVGQSLEQVIASGRLPLPRLLSIAMQLADALASAHERGIVHRDLKPGNVMVGRDGRVKVLDFGLAKFAPAGATGRSQLPTEAQTREGVIMGTVPYMSPEQLSGGAVDHRSDIFSLGVILYEMCCGSRPFGGNSVAEIASSILRDSPASIAQAREGVPSGLCEIVRRCLEKDVRDRLQSARDLHGELQEAHREFPESADAGRDNAGPVSKATQPETPTTVIVLPFVNRSADADDHYFSDGLTDEVITDLSRVGSLRTISRNSAMSLKGTTKDTRTLAREIGVTHLVTGTVRRSGSSLRITAELVDASTDTTIWSEKFTGTMDDVFGIQESISRQIVAALKLSLTDSEERGVSEHPVDDPLAYDCYLRACQLMYDWTTDAQSRAMHLVDQALAISGDVPVLLAMKGQLHWNMVNTTAAPPDVALARAAEFSERALACDPDSRLAIFVRGLVACTRGRIESGLVDLYRAYELLPGDANVLVELCRFSLSAGLRSSERLVEKVVRVDPLSPQAHLLEAMYYGTYGPVELAVAPARRSIELLPSPSHLHYCAAWWISAAGHRPEALSIYDRIRAETKGSLQVLASFLGHAIQGNEGRALQPPTNQVARSNTNEWVCRIIANGYALLGRAEDALYMLRRAVRFGFINYPSLSTDVVLLQCLEEHPDYQELLAQVKPRWEAIVQWERSC